MLAATSQAAPSSASWMRTVHVLPVCGHSSSMPLHSAMASITLTNAASRLRWSLSVTLVKATRMAAAVALDSGRIVVGTRMRGVLEEPISAPLLVVPAESKHSKKLNCQPSNSGVASSKTSLLANSSSAARRLMETSSPAVVTTGEREMCASLARDCSSLAASAELASRWWPSGSCIRPNAARSCESELYSKGEHVERAHAMDVQASTCG